VMKLTTVTLTATLSERKTDQLVGTYFFGCVIWVQT